MNRINTSSPYRAPGIRAAALAVLLFAVVGPQPAAARPVALTYAEAAAWMRAEGIGDHTESLEQSGTPADFFSNAKNQLTGRRSRHGTLRGLCRAGARGGGHH